MTGDLMGELTQLNEQHQKDLAESLKEINELAVKAYEAKEAADVAEALSKELKNKLCSLMENAGVDKISAPNCTVSGKMKSSVTVPKEVQDKLRLFEYIGAASKSNMSAESVCLSSLLLSLVQDYPALFSMLTINAAAFSAWYVKEQEEKIKQGEIDWKLDFINAFEYYSIGFRKKAK